ncbi:MAG: hypothetical protein ACI9OJ_005936 [Myxococcota bacterium]
MAIITKLDVIQAVAAAIILSRDHSQPRSFSAAIILSRDHSQPPTTRPPPT